MLGVAVVAAACGPTAFVPPPPSPQRVYGMSEVDERPEIVLTPPLRYPAGGRDGVVVVRVVIDSAGNPEPATAVVRWAISARGFADQYADKILVLVDGRSAFDPLFNGVMWNEQDMLLEDIERIEVIRGPGEVT